MFTIRTLKRLLYRLVCWINYPTSRERMWHMFTMGKAQGRKEALKELPIVQVQPRQTTDPLKVHLPPGEWSRQWREMQGIKSGKNGHVDTSGLASEVPLARGISDDSWLNSAPVIRTAHKDDTEGEATEHMPAIKKLRYITRQLERHAG